MATVLKLKQGDTGTTLNLNVGSGSPGFTLEEDGWNPVVATPVHMGDPPPILETLNFLLSNTSYDNLATNMQSLHEMQILADRYINDPQSETPIWIHAQMDGETNERRALVREIDVQYNPSWFGAGEATTNIPLVVTVLRSPYWESITARDLPDAAPSAAACVEYDYTAAGASVGTHDIVGDVGARIRFFDFLSGSVDRFWMGVRSASKHGATGLSNFAEIWECEDGTNNPSESGITDVVDAAASGGDRVQVVETDLDWDEADYKEVCFLSISTATGSKPEDQTGNFLWILRTKVSAGTWEVRASIIDGVDEYSPVNYTSPQTNVIEVSDTDWRFLELGIAPIPTRNLHAITAADIPKTRENTSFRVYIYARRTSGAGNLNIDCVIPLPIDEGFLKMTHFAGSANDAFGQSPEGIYGAVMWSAAAPSITKVTAEPSSVENFVLPPGDGRIYCVYERDGSSVLSDTITFNDSDRGKYYERWLSLRGSE
jgi:hypothetical protein